MLVVGVFSLQKVVEMLEEMLKEVVVGWRAQADVVDEAHFPSPLKGLRFVQLLKCWLCKLQSDTVVENWAPSVDQCQLQALQFPVYLISLLSMLLGCNGFPGDSRGCCGSDGQQTTKQ